MYGLAIFGWDTIILKSVIWGCKKNLNIEKIAFRVQNPEADGLQQQKTTPGGGGGGGRGGLMYSALSSFNTTTEVLLSKAPNPQLLPGRRSINGCPLLRVCVHSVCVCVCVCVFTAVWVHFGRVKCRAKILSMGHHTWSYVTLLSYIYIYTVGQKSI